ncbi:MAG: hypothetical protein HY821_01170 [Acidobacteria bacterium]|nr:hypothetical protein [Acidobacteriota bacterium]
MSQSNAAGPERARGAATALPDPAKPLFPFAPDEAAAFDNPSPSESGRTDTRNPKGRTFPGGLPHCIEPGPDDCVSRELTLYKKITLCFNLRAVERMEENFNTGSRKHDVSNSNSLSRQHVSAEGRFKESSSIRFRV